MRDQLNTRLDDGQEADQILPWLNSLPEVQEIIARRFDGVCVSPQNLSAWRQGGFKEWLLHRELLDSAVHVREHLEEMGEILECDSSENVPLAIADHMIAQLSIRFNAFLARWSGGPLDTQVAMLLKMGQFTLKLQQSAYRARRQAIELPGLERQSEREYEREIKMEVFRDHIANQKRRAAKAQKAQHEETPKTPAPKNSATQHVVQPVPQPPPPPPNQAQEIKPNQASRRQQIRNAVAWISLRPRAGCAIVTRAGGLLRGSVLINT